MTVSYAREKRRQWWSDNKQANTRMHCYYGNPCDGVPLLCGLLMCGYSTIYCTVQPHCSQTLCCKRQVDWWHSTPTNLCHVGGGRAHRWQAHAMRQHVGSIALHGPQCIRHLLMAQQRLRDTLDQTGIRPNVVPTEALDYLLEC